MFNPFKNKAREKSETKALLAALYYITMADNIITEDERARFRKHCQERGLTPQETSEIVSNNSTLSKNYPRDKNKQHAFFSDLVTMSLADGAIAPAEYEYLEQYAAMMGLSETKEQIREIIQTIIEQNKNA